MTDQRNYLLRARRLPIRVPITQSTIPMFLDSEIMNLSKGGVFIRSDITLPLGSEIEFEFRLPGSEKAISALGVVVWSRPRTRKKKGFLPDHPPGMGVAFKTIGTEDLESILAEIERLSEKS